MKRIIGALVVVAAVAAIPASHVLWGKGHVPIGKAQVCHKGKVITVGAAAVDGHVRGHGDCQLPACDFNNIFFTGDPCTVNDRGDGKCVLPNERAPADGLTAGCPAGTF